MYSPEKARQNMVDCQIHPSNVVDPAILNAFETVPREKFVPEAHKGTAYHDENLIFKDGRFMMAPTTHARMLQSLNLSKNDIALDIGCGNGYSSAILSSLVTTVIALESVQKNLDDAQIIWDEMEYLNIAGFKGTLNKGCANHAPYDVIIINGSCSELPTDIAMQLNDKGRLIYIQKDSNSAMGQVTLVKKTNDTLSSFSIFDASTPYLSGFEPREEFKFS